MKSCPKCQNKYTDDSLNYCLQDGERLDEFVEEKTLVLDADSFANEATITENFSDQQQSAQTDENATARKTEVVENDSVETVVNPSETNRSVKPPGSTRSGVGFLAGVVISLLLVGIVGGAIYFYSSYSNPIASDTNSNSANANRGEEKILSDSSDVKISASSTRKSDKGNFYDPQLAFDANPRTAWCEGARGTGIGQWIAFDFKEEVSLKKIVIQPGYFKTPELWRKNNRLSSVYVEFEGKSTRVFNFQDEMKEQTIDVEGVKTNSVFIKIKGVYPGASDSKDTLISEVSFVVE